ncbi:hypothetical protein NUU61_001645 [Penicillium alfredii]|uniref:Uncharacterized protein n=1 Tax=Penicillium alfredii TaxID=1506179 RepID=A0A9W9FQ87_9EURO|nr:uncharacterized protein NUU61_001645 [Penicillium alfredii]KAJ5104298.1 hypothetical protein NUU61_001645 [Penicillium alfredii]
MESPSGGSGAPAIAFISGPVDTGPDEAYFHTHYVPRINHAIDCGHHFVIGPLPRGVDADALAYLLAYSVAPSRVSIFVTPAEDGMWGAHFRSFGVHVQVVDGQMSRDRDAALTQASTYDILRLRTADEARVFYGRLWREGYVTNTERNWKRRRGIPEDAVVGVDEINQTMGDVSNVPNPRHQGTLARWVDELLRRHQ